MELDRDPQTRLDHAAARSAELALAHACLAGDVQALVRFEREFGACLRAGAAHVCAEPSFVEETVASLRGSLFSGAQPKLAAYSGRGPLAAWLRIVAARGALDLCRSEQRRRARERVVQLASEQASPDAERGLDRARYAQAFAIAMRAALRALQPRQRALLLLRYREGLELNALSERFAVHRATVQRWLALATAELRQALASELAQAGAQLSPSEFTGLGPHLTSALGPAIASWLGAGSVSAGERQP
jgi:RNA polymerase sigma-70 factor (ECF subfamily)